MDSDRGSAPTTVADAQGLFVAGAIVEGGFALVGIGVSLLLGTPHPLRLIEFTWAATGWGFLAALPILLLMLALVHLPLRICREVLRVLNRHLVPLLRQWTIPQIALICLLAGFGEEVLFRGAIQQGLEVWLDGTADRWVAVVVAGIFFGLLHAVSPGYFLFAASVGIYFGTIYAVSGNLLVPIIAHAVYDFAACLYLVYRRG